LISMDELKPDIGKKKRTRYLTIKAPQGYHIVRQSILSDSPKQIRILFEVDQHEEKTLQASDRPAVETPSSMS